MVADEPFDTSTHNDLKLMQGFPPPPDKRVDRSNGLWVPPFNRWSYQNARQIWPTAPVRRSLKAVDLPRRPEASMVPPCSVDTLPAAEIAAASCTPAETW